MQKLKFNIGKLIGFSLLIGACNTNPQTSDVAVDNTPKVIVNAPAFSADTAYYYIEKQLSFGPRAMNTKGHEACAEFLISEAKKYADTVYVQRFDATGYDGKTLKSTNIIASFNPQATSRVLLCSHWDSRPWADQDSERQDEPILAANDGASGVGVLLEIARLLKVNPTQNIGVDVFFIDTEDYGKSGFEDSYCLGAQYWAKQPHLAHYKADFGILLDMVGAPGAQFAREGNSAFNAGWVLDKVWTNASQLGYGSRFIQQSIGPITDDHFYINTIIKIPTIDIIHYDPTSPSQTFGAYWHTHDDDMKTIDKGTLEAVGRTVVYTVFQYDAEKEAK